MSGIYFVLLILGLVQGIAEFLPISSSGHLVILEQIRCFKEALEGFGSEPEIFINVSLHIASLCAILIFLRNDLRDILTGLFSGIVKRDFMRRECKIVIYIMAAAVPAGIAGVLFHDFFERLFSSALTVFFMLIFNGLVLISTNFIPINNRKIEEIGIARSIVIGLCQAIAIIPGISRSGSTITGGMLVGLPPEESARFSFLIAIPVIAGAGLLELLKIAGKRFPFEILLPVIIAMLITLVVSLAALRILFAAVRRIRIDVFGYYTILLGLAGVVYKISL